MGAFEDSGATEVCLCSSDTLYEERAAEVAGELKATGAGHVFLAGRPGQYPDVDAYVFAGCDAVAVLSAASTVWECPDGSEGNPDFSGIELGVPKADGGNDEWRSAVKKATGRGRSPVGDPGGHRGRAAVHRAGPGGPGLPGHLPGHRPVSARPVPDDVRQPALDDPSVRRLLHCGGVQRLLPAQSRGRPEGPVRRLRPAHPSRLRQRPPARDR